MQTNNSNSEVARLMEQITAEHEAAERGLSGIAAGVARHQFINAHMDRIEQLRQALATQVGEGEALAAMCRIMLDEQGISCQ